MICLDASVVGMMMCADEQGAAILERYEKARLAGEGFIAPTLLPYEIASILRKKLSRKLLTSIAVQGAVHFFRGLGIGLIDFEGLLERSLSLAGSYDSITVYDASYLAVAEREKAFLWTADRRFYDVVSFSFVDIELFQGPR